MFSQENEGGENHKSFGSNPPLWPANTGPTPQSTGVVLELLPEEMLSLNLSWEENRQEGWAEGLPNILGPGRGWGWAGEDGSPLVIEKRWLRHACSVFHNYLVLAVRAFLLSRGHCNTPRDTESSQWLSQGIPCQAVPCLCYRAEFVTISVLQPFGHNLQTNSQNNILTYILNTHKNI